MISGISNKPVNIITSAISIILLLSPFTIFGTYSNNLSCSIMSLSANPGSPQQVGTSITISGSANCDTGVRAIRFKIDGGIIYEIGAPTGTATWNTGGVSAGNHTITLEAAELGDNNWANAASQSISYTLTSAPQATPQPQNPSCSIASLSANPSSPQQVGISIVISGSANCDTGVRAIRFKVDGGIIYEIGAPSGNATWNTGGASAGNHTITLEAAGQGDNNWSYAASQSISYNLTSAPQPTPQPQNPSCSINSLSASPDSPQLVGTSITISGSANCDTGVRAIRFKVDGGIIYEIGAPSAKAKWNTGGFSAGNHTITLEAAGQGDNNWSYAASQSISYNLTSAPQSTPQPQNPSCSITSLSASPSSPQQVGTSITISGSANCDTGVRAIRFKVDNGIIYEIGASSAKTTWNTGGYSEGDHTITLEAASQGDNNWSNAVSQSITFTLHSGSQPQNPTCSISSLSASPSSPQQVGTAVTISGSASCDNGVRAIRFKVDGGVINEIGASSGSTTWNTNGISAGSHTITLEAAGQGDNDWSYAASRSITYVLGNKEEYVGIVGGAGSLIFDDSGFNKVHIYASDVERNSCENEGNLTVTYPMNNDPKWNKVNVEDVRFWTSNIIAFGKIFFPYLIKHGSPVRAMIWKLNSSQLQLCLSSLLSEGEAKSTFIWIKQ